MGDEGGVMKLLLEMMTYLEDHTRLDESSDPCAPSPAEPSEPEASRSEASALWDEDEYQPPPRPAALVQARCRQREERRHVIRLAGEKVAAIEEQERTMRREKDLRRQLLLQNMAARLQVETRAERAERAARHTSRPARSYSRTLGRSFCSRPAVTPVTASSASSPSTPPPAPSAQPTLCRAPAALSPWDEERPERKKRRRPEPPDDLLEADVRELLGELAAPPSPLADDDDEALSKRLRLFPFPDCEVAEQGCGGDVGGRACAPAPQDQVRFTGDMVGCAAAAGFADFHSFHQLVPSVES